MARQQELFTGMEPPRKASQSQWFTPAWLAARLVRPSWIPLGARVLEPACGSGNLIAALLRAGHDPGNILGIEKDPEFAAYARARFSGRVRIVEGDFFDEAIDDGPFSVFQPDIMLTNPPFENNLHTRFVLHGLRLCEWVIAVIPTTFEFTQERDRTLWAPKGIVVRRALLPERVDYGGSDCPSFESVALKIGRRSSPRGRDDVRLVSEEVWTP
jgi:predicted RNA methylase